ncbi:MAG TPA: threonine synthase [Dehalococcoidia bacterium]|nr:threonine synthase [Dehalococcoidia bacterium]
MGQLVCTECQALYPLDEPVWRCDCGGILDIDFTPLFNLARIKRRRPTIWRYREAIPLDHDANIVSLDEGFTPLMEITIGGKTVFIKQDHLFPTGSYKDRGASVLVSKVKELGVTEVVEDSSGNAGSAIAAYCARASVKCHIYVPQNTSAGKLAQIQLYGAELHQVPGTREDTAQAALGAAEKRYYASHAWNPFFFQGTKTFAFEVSEQLGWKPPDTVILPVGNGTLLLGAYIGFRELLQAGVIDRMPRIIGVQAENCAPLYRAYQQNRAEVPPVENRETLAEGIAIARPVRGRQILDAIRQTKGQILAVSEDEIGKALGEICRQGYYIEPTSAATIAGIKEYLPGSSPGEVIVSVFTGHGLKATEKMLKLLP